MAALARTFALATLLGALAWAPATEAGANAAKLRTVLTAGEPFAEVEIGGIVVMRIRAGHGGLSAGNRAQIVAARLNAVLEESLPGEAIQPAHLGEDVVVRLRDRVIVTADPATARLNGTTPWGLAYTWANNLRLALGAPRLPIPHDLPFRGGYRVTAARIGAASWYGPGFQGRRTSSGEAFDQEALTAAHPYLPFGTFVRVTNLDNGKSVVVRINDRGPWIAGRIIDLSRRAAWVIDFLDHGIAMVKIEVLGWAG